MAALQSPFYGDKLNLYSLCKKIENCEYPPLPADIYSQQLRDLISRCICSNPSKRPDVAEVLNISEQMNAHFQSEGAKTVIRSHHRNRGDTDSSTGTVVTLTS
ncbi:unnamed protein product [Brugia timori]|nr:unnamed protein product [Brugia timori]